MNAAQPPAAGDFRQVMVGLGLAMLLSALDQTIVVTAMPTIGVELGDPQNLPSIVTAYLVASTAVTPLYGKFADVYGRRLVLMTGIGVFVVGSVFCALAPTVGMLAAARFLQGLGGGGLISLSQTIIADLVSPLERGRYQGYFAAVFATSSIAGPALGGFFAQYLDWSLIFWINLPLGLLAMLIVNARLKRLPIRRHPHRIDYVGACLLMFASGALVLALGWGGGRFRWSSAPILSLLGASALFWVLFARRSRSFPEPLIPTRVLGLRIVRNATLSGALGLGGFVGLSVVMPIYFEAALGMSARDSGLALIPVMIATVFGAFVSGRLMSRLSSYRTTPVLGLGFGALAALAAALTIDRLSFAGLSALLSITTFGVGTMLPVATVCVQNAVDPRDLGTATASTQFFRQLGAAALVAVFGVLALAGGRGALLEPGVSAAAAVAAMNAGYRLVFIALAICMGLSCLFLAIMEELPLQGRGRH
jgi:MFS family permease